MNLFDLQDEVAVVIGADPILIGRGQCFDVDAVPDSFMPLLEMLGALSAGPFGVEVRQHGFDIGERVEELGQPRRMVGAQCQEADQPIPADLAERSDYRG